jgi:hypothetical protein
VCCGRNCGLLLGTAQGRRHRKKLDLRLVHNLNREATQQVGGHACLLAVLEHRWAALPRFARSTAMPSAAHTSTTIVRYPATKPSLRLQAAGLADRDLLDVRYEGEVPHVLPYFIAADENRRCLVLAIRGGWGL